MIHKIFLTMTGVAALAVFAALPARAAGENQFFGTLTGATLGGIVGNQFGHGDGRIAATAGGGVAGGWIGNDIGYALDNNRASPAASAGPQLSSAPGSAPILNSLYAPNYVAPDDTLPPPSIYDDSHGDYCRAYSEQVRIGDQVEENYGTACLQPDGSWRAVDGQ